MISPFILPADYPRIQRVHRFQELVATRVANGVNARCRERQLPKASFIGFTGTPVESGGSNTPAGFGDIIERQRFDCHLTSCERSSYNYGGGFRGRSCGCR